MTHCDLPSWAADIVPLTVTQASTVLGVSTSAFYEFIAEFPHYELHGNKKLFYPEHITKLRKDRSWWQLLKSSGETTGSMPEERSSRDVLQRALAQSRRK